ncbi:hypothetical protein DAI22_04g019100 [Oryza sativa Japonica Group]|nr:hypothetical protein DAI22_04g019100 [Oryza sativa Japonica Group]
MYRSFCLPLWIDVVSTLYDLWNGSLLGRPGNGTHLSTETIYVTGFHSVWTIHNLFSSSGKVNQLLCQSSGHLCIS